MRPDLADRMFEILLHGLALRDRGVSGQWPNLLSEQAKFKGFLGPNSAAPWGASAREVHSQTGDPTAGGLEFLGIRYALVCWLDEILIQAGWQEWESNQLEFALYRTNLRYDNFWRQARLAEAAHDGGDSYEAFLWCTLLGFRGSMEHTPDLLREWVSAARTRTLRSSGREPPTIPESVPPKDPVPLRGEDSYRAAIRRLVVVALIAVPALAFLFVLLFRKSV